MAARRLGAGRQWPEEVGVNQVSLQGPEPGHPALLHGGTVIFPKTSCLLNCGVDRTCQWQEEGTTLHREVTGRP